MVFHGFPLSHAPNRVPAMFAEAPRPRREGEGSAPRTAESGDPAQVFGHDATFDAKSAAVWMIYDDLWV